MSETDTCPVAYEGLSALVSYPVGRVRCETGVLLCRPWGRDEVCCRKFYRTLADVLAASGYPTLRFDYSGTVDSLDPDADEGLEDWVRGAEKSADVLKDISGCERIVVFGLGLGAVVSHELAGRRHDLSGAIIAAPIVNGRRYIREINLLAKMLYETEHIPLNLLDTRKTSVLGNVMPGKVAEDVSRKKLDDPATLTQIPLLFFSRGKNKSDCSYAKDLKARSRHVTVKEFHEFEDLTAEVLTSKVPFDLIESCLGWMRETQPARKSFPAPVNADKYPPVLTADNFTETAAFVETRKKKLLTVTTRPVSCSPDAPVFIFGNTGGYDHHGGLARDSVTAARALAEAGAISIRFDGSNTGDSYPDLPAGEETLYSETSIQDFKNIVDFAAARFEGPITLVGRCSSAYSAFHLAARDQRVRQLILVNQLKYIWDPKVPVNLKYMGHRSTEEYKKRLLDPQIFKRLFKGQINIRAASLGIARLLKQRTAEKITPFFPRMTSLGRMRLEALDMFETLRDRNIPVHIFCTLGDESINLLKVHFGPKFEAFSQFRNISYSTIGDSDHCLMPDHARHALTDLLLKAAHSLQSTATRSQS
ncbi:alpha/beta hydrolase [uncultured Roseibium sp.]|uniref:serine aminopeptidase domain-containing protein n=1 Tax=uncultured Roseibium sp. TaxID=1936171 RepID=UPI0026273116|nr:alpha/beta hydrolase [uncultured Roseibium sp.]